MESSDEQSPSTTAYEDSHPTDWLLPEFFKLLPIQLCHLFSCPHLVALILPGPEARLTGPGTAQPARWCCWKRAGVDNMAIHHDVGP